MRFLARYRSDHPVFSFAMSAVVVFVVLLAAAGTAYETISSYYDSERYPQVGRSVDLGGFTLNLHCAGTGSPTVILESGVGLPALSWGLVQPEIARFTRVCSYDRAGYGWSDPRPGPRTAGRLADELHLLLSNAGVNPPYLLVGHSFGGMIVRMYASRHPGEVAGMVLVDSSQEDQQTRGFRPTPSPLRPVAPVLYRLGISRALFWLRGESNLPQDMAAALEYLMIQPKATETVFAEMSAFSASADEVRQAGDLGSMPLVVLTGTRSAERSPRLHAIWMNELQPRLVRLSTRGKHELADSGHNIQLEKPEAVVNAVREVYEAAVRP